jgi:poly(hydroxyalkanoate) depolymerase family esterase
MQRHRNRAFAAASICLGLGLFAALPARAASLVQVDRATWTAGVSLPSYMQMYIYVPDRLATKPPILVSSHSCGSMASGQWDNITKIKAAADANGFILILPDSNPMRNCWDVGSTAALKHDGGGDTHAVAQMVRYALTKYNGDAARVYAHGGSSGGMMTQALMAVYPDIFRAGAARAGVPAGCWADGYDPGQQWSNNCAGGNTNKTAQQWGDQVRAMFPGYTGHRPRLQIMQGQSDTTISYKNTAESIEEWTNVLGLSTAPTSMDTGFKAANATYNRQFWKNACGYTVFEAWSSPGGTHSMPYEEADILKFFGLDVAGGADPEPDCTGSTGTGGAGGRGGSGGSGGSVGSGGSTGAGGRGGGGAGGRGGSSGSGGSTSGAGGAAGTGGNSAGGGGAVGAGGNSAGTSGSVGIGGNSAGAGGSVGIGGNGAGTAGSNDTGGAGGTGRGGVGGSGSGGTSSGGSTATGGNSGTGTGGSTQPPGGTDSGGGCAIDGRGDRRASVVEPLLLVALGIAFRRRRRSRR